MQQPHRRAGRAADRALLRPRNRRPARPNEARHDESRRALRRAGLRFVADVVYGLVKVVWFAVFRIAPKPKRGMFG